MVQQPYEKVRVGAIVTDPCYSLCFTAPCILIVVLALLIVVLSVLLTLVTISLGAHGLHELQAGCHKPSCFLGRSSSSWGQRLPRVIAATVMATGIGRVCPPQEQRD